MEIQRHGNVTNAPICLDGFPEGTLNTLKHLADHLEQIALTGLPTATDPADSTDSDAGTDDMSSHQSMFYTRRKDRRKFNHMGQGKSEANLERMETMKSVQIEATTPTQHTFEREKHKYCQQWKRTRVDIATWDPIKFSSAGKDVP
ncbi:hypothetical protein PG987_013274, partial [Apiospora arundinis]